MASPGVAEQTYAEQDQMTKLNGVLSRHGITIADANDLVLLQGYEIVVIADDSGSMTLSSVPQAERRLGQREPSRWEELCGTLRMVVELATIFDADGVDIHFLNRPALTHLRSRDDPQLDTALQRPPSGGTPLTETLRNVLTAHAADPSEKPVLIIIATDGMPNGGPAPFKQIIVDAIRKRFGQTIFKFQILACTDDDTQVGWLNQFDEEFAEVDVTDDYHSEKQEVLRTGKCPTFKRSDWIIKALLGPISNKFDSWDEPNGPGRQQHTPAYHNNHAKPAQNKKEGCGCVLA